MFEIRMLNDDFRRTFNGGIVCQTRSVMSLPDEDRTRLQNLVRSYDDFTEENDPWGEHDFGMVTLNGEDYYFKIDYYDRLVEGASPDPANPSVTTRVMTILRSDEY